MLINTLHIENLRNHRQSDLNFSDGFNLLYGDNGSGKTTVLEAISICSMSKTFLPITDSGIVTNSADYYLASLKSTNELELPYQIAVKFTKGSRKQIKSTYADNLYPKDIIGELPIVVLSPDFKSITFGSPQDRRDFIDKILSQSSKQYFEELMKYRKILKQRNNLLTQAKIDRTYNQELLDVWTDSLISSGAELLLRRHFFIKEFVPVFERIYPLISSNMEEVSFHYEPNSIPSDIMKSNDFNKVTLTSFFKELFTSNRSAELQRGTTLFGPQKDELKICINNGIAKDYASQGQHKSLLISIKYAEFIFLSEKTNKTPIILLDDIFSELDSNRTQKVIEMLHTLKAQTFITLTDLLLLNNSLDLSNNQTVHRLSDGIVTRER